MLTGSSQPLYSSTNPSCELSAGSTYSDMKKQEPGHSGASGEEGGELGGGGGLPNPSATGAKSRETPSLAGIATD